MNTEAYGTTVFCDDIRHETNGKLTLVGCYSTEMNFSGPPPGMLPTFAALVNIRIPKSVPFKTIKLCILKEEGSEISEIFGAEANVSDEDKVKALQGGDPESTEERIFSMMFPFQLPLLTMKESGFIKVRAYLDGSDEIRLGALRVNFPKETNEQLDS